MSWARDQYHCCYSNDHFIDDQVYSMKDEKDGSQVRVRCSAVMTDSMPKRASSEGDLVSYGKIVLFGDSITQFSFDPAISGSGSALANFFARRLDVINRGFSGYTSEQARIILPRIFPKRDNDVKLVYLFFGANDAVLPGLDQHIPKDRYIENCRAMLLSEQLRGKVIAIIPPPIDERAHDPIFGANRTVEATKAYGDALRELCVEINVPYADVWTTYMLAVGWKQGDQSLIGSKSIPQNPKLVSFFCDGLHPVKEGYRLIYEAIMNTITKEFPYLLPGDELENPHTPLWSFAIMPKINTMIRWKLNTKTWNAAKYSKLLNGVPHADQEKAARFRFDKDRYMSLGSVLLMRRFVEEVLGRKLAQSDVIPRNESNRPYFTHKAVRPHDFNISHHDGVVVLAGLVDSGPVGTDLTCIPLSETPGTNQEAINAYLADFEDSFGKEEWQQIGSDGARFAQHWALKEAYVKATGTGIVVKLREITFTNIKYVSATDPYHSQAARVRDGNGEVGKFWNFELHYDDSRYIAIASHCIPEIDYFLDVEY